MLTFYQQALEMLLRILSAALNMILMRRKTLIDPMIESKRSKIASMERALDKLRIEVAALEQARTVMAAEPAPTRRGRSNGIAASGKRRGRSLSEGWKRVLAAIALKGADGASLDEISQFAVAQGIELKRATLRAQMSNYVKRTYLGRTGDGKFFIALNGLTVAGLQGPPNGETQVSGSSRIETGTPR
jgi:hypothetical protein